MNARATAARRIVKARRAEAAAHAKGLHTIKGHAIAAGLDVDLADGIAGGLRGKRKVTGVEGTRCHMIRRTERGVAMVRGGRRYSKAEFLTLAGAYAPRLPKYKAAREILLAY